MAQVEINGISTHYQTKGEGPDVVLVHGLTSSLAFWYATRVLPALTPEFRVTLYDLRGHGRSDVTAEGYTSRALAEDLHSLMDELGIARARFVGHSFGGAIALHFALLFPDRTEGVAVCDTGFAALRRLRRIDDWFGWNQWKEELPGLGITPEWFAEADAKGVDAVLERSASIPVQFGMRRGGSRDTPRFRRLLRDTTVGADFRDPAGLTEVRLVEIRPPVLCLYGDRSPFREVAPYLNKALPNCHGEIVKDVGHFFLLQSSERFLEHVTPFLRDPAGYIRQD